jgi:hypothetical protein
MPGTARAAAGWIAVAAAGWIAVATVVVVVMAIAAAQAKAETHRRLIEVPIHRCALWTELPGAGRVVRCTADLPC